MNTSKKLFSLILVMPLLHASEAFIHTAVIAGLLAGKYFFTPDTTEVDLQDMELATFLPITDTADKFVAEEENDIFKVLQKREGLLKIKGQLYQVYPTIPDAIKDTAEPITLFTGGGAKTVDSWRCFSIKEKRAYRAYVALKSGAVQGPCVVDSVPYRSMRSFNPGEERDVRTFSKIYDGILFHKPDARIILHNVCVGALTQYNFLRTRPEAARNVCGVVSESPLLAFDLLHKLLRMPLSMARIAKRLLFPTPITDEMPLFNVDSFPKVPVFLGALPDDSFTAHSDIEKFKGHLDSLGVQAQFFTSARKDLSHGKIGEDENFIAAVKKFRSSLGKDTAP